MSPADGDKFVPGMCASPRFRSLLWVVAIVVRAVVFPVSAQPVLEMQAEVRGKDILLVATVDGEDEALPVLQAIWRGVPGGLSVFQLLPTGEPGPELHLMLDRMLEAALGGYLDEHVRFARDGVVTDVPPERMVLEMDAMVKAAAEDFGVEELFGGFSPATREQLARLSRIDWGKARSGVEGDDGQDKYLAIYRYVRGQRDELERQVRADLLPLADVAVLGGKSADPRTTVRINSTCGTVFDEENFLCALDLQLADTGGGGADPELGLSIMRAIEERSKAAVAPAVEAPKVRKRDRWLKDELDNINSRIDRMDQRKELWELRDRMDDMEDRLTGLDMELREVKDTQVRVRENPLADLSELTGRNITIRFARNAVTFDGEYRVLLNEVFEQLARSPYERVLVTGYTDRSGDPTVNLRLSEQRAKAVRNYLLQRGIAPERLLVNYYGDSRSLGRNPDERRVEVEWLR